MAHSSNSQSLGLGRFGVPALQIFRLGGVGSGAVGGPSGLKILGFREKLQSFDV